MELLILCTPKFSAKDRAGIARAAKKSGMTVEKFIRVAVRRFSRECVPTHGRRAKGKAV